jgi:hypothetical protein
VGTYLAFEFLFLASAFLQKPSLPRLIHCNMVSTCAGWRQRGRVGAGRLLSVPGPSLGR